MKLVARQKIADRGIVFFMLVYGLGVFGGVSFLAYYGIHMIHGEKITFVQLREFAFSSLLNGVLIGLGLWFILFAAHKSDL